MKLENTFTVPASVETAWRVLLDVERIAPCMPGAAVTAVDGNRFTGTVKVKLGPINLTYGGSATIVSQDDAAHVAVIEGIGKETRGSGTATAVIRCRLTGRGEQTDVEVDTALAITGRPAQFGRGVLADVSGKLVDQFAACLAAEIARDGPVPAGTSGGGGGAKAATALVGDTGAASPVAPPISALTSPGTEAAAAQGADSGRATRPPAEAIDLLGTAALPVVKRLAPVVGVLLLVLLAVRAFRRH